MAFFFFRVGVKYILLILLSSVVRYPSSRIALIPKFDMRDFARINFFDSFNLNIKYLMCTLGVFLESNTKHK